MRKKPSKSIRRSAGEAKKKAGQRPTEVMVDLDQGNIWHKTGERLTGAELRILALLFRREGRPVSADLLADQVDPVDLGCCNPRFHISNLRRKLGHSDDRPVIATRIGIGYYLVLGSLQFTGNLRGEDKK